MLCFPALLMPTKSTVSDMSGRSMKNTQFVSLPHPPLVINGDDGGMPQLWQTRSGRLSSGATHAFLCGLSTPQVWVRELVTLDWRRTHRLMAQQKCTHIDMTLPCRDTIRRVPIFVLLYVRGTLVEQQGTYFETAHLCCNAQRCASVFAWHMCGALIEQQLAYFCVSLPCRGKQGGCPILIWRVSGASIQQQRAHICMPTLRRDAQRRPSIIVKRVCCTLIQQQRTHLHISLPCRDVQMGQPILRR